jgi:DNA-binding CsgD family transcriptional regulator
MIVMHERLRLLGERAAGVTQALLRLRATQRARVTTNAGAIPLPLLTKREIAILRMIADGKDNAAIATELHFALGTIKLHVREILDTMESPTRAAAAVRAVRLKLLLTAAETASANEVNEEMQAGTEELETLNDEVQATVEELNTSNDEIEAFAGAMLIVRPSDELAMYVAPPLALADFACLQAGWSRQATIAVGGISYALTRDTVEVPPYAVFQVRRLPQADS